MVEARHGIIDAEAVYRHITKQESAREIDVASSPKLLKHRRVQAGERDQRQMREDEASKSGEDSVGECIQCFAIRVARQGRNAQVDYSLGVGSGKQ